MYENRNNIINNKKLWDDAYKAGDITKANKIAADTQKYYQNLYDNGDAAIADNLKTRDYSNAKSYINKWDTIVNKQAFRPYMYNRAKEYGITADDINKDISYNEQTGEVSLGGKNLGKPLAEYDGVSYWDTDYLENAFKDYIKRTGKTKTADMLYNSGIQNVSDNIQNQTDKINSDQNEMKKYYEKLIASADDTPIQFTKEDAKKMYDDIMNKYGLSALNARDNVSAYGAAMNSGNIDSNSAANAMRQQMSTLSQGQSNAWGMVSDMYNKTLTQYNDRLQRVNELLQGLGYQNKQAWDSQAANNQLGMQNYNNIFNNTETAKNNNLDRELALADATGYLTEDRSKYYYDENGNIKKTVLPTESHRRFDEQSKLTRETLASEERQANASAAASANAAVEEAWAKAYSDELKAQNDKEIAQMKIDSNERIAGAKSETNGGSSKGTKTSTNGQPPAATISDTNVKKWVDYLNNEYSRLTSNLGKYTAIKEVDENSYKASNDAKEYIVKQVIGSSNLTDEQKLYLLRSKFGISDDTINTVIKDRHNR